MNSGGGGDTNIWAEWIFSTNILHQDCNLTPKTALARDNVEMKWKHTSATKMFGPFFFSLKALKPGFYGLCFELITAFIVSAIYFA